MSTSFPADLAAHMRALRKIFLLPLCRRPNHGQSSPSRFYEAHAHRRRHLWVLSSVFLSSGETMKPP